MILRYAAVLFVPDRYTPSWSPVVVGRFKTRAAAERRIARLSPIAVTRYRTGRRERFCEVRDDKTGRSYEAEHPSVLVPSVGELGYW